MMRAFHVIGAAFLMAWAIPTASRADGTTATTAASAAAAPGCHCPRPLRHVWRRHGRVYAWHRRHGRSVPIALATVWPAYNPPIPSVYDSAYDRVMTQYTRARELDGEYLIEPPYVPRPPLPGFPHFRVAASGAVYEYDIMADGYVQLAQRDARRAPVAPTP
jgi:hypothetical protein